MPRVRVILLALGAPALVALVAQGAVAQTRKPKPAPAAAGAAHPAPAAPTPKKPPAATDGGAAAAGFGTGPAAPTATPTATANPDAGVLEAKTLDGGTRVFKFSELDIEGRLKSPQLVYFLRRVRAEFSAGDLGHRSFMREMSETRKESSF
jgi:hypothetical protein